MQTFRLMHIDESHIPHTRTRSKDLDMPDRLALPIRRTPEHQENHNQIQIVHDPSEHNAILVRSVLYQMKAVEVIYHYCLQSSLRGRRVGTRRGDHRAAQECSSNIRARETNVLESSTGPKLVEIRSDHLPGATTLEGDKVACILRPDPKETNLMADWGGDLAKN